MDGGISVDKDWVQYKAQAMYRNGTLNLSTGYSANGTTTRATTNGNLLLYSYQVH